MASAKCIVDVLFIFLLIPRINLTRLTFEISKNNMRLNSKTLNYIIIKIKTSI